MFAGAKASARDAWRFSHHTGIVPNQAEPYHVPLRKIRGAAAGQVKRVSIPRMRLRVLEYLRAKADCAPSRLPRR